MSSLSALTALSPIDGRYAAKADPLREWLSEAAFMRHRVKVEVHWLIALSQAGLAEIPRWPMPSARCWPWSTTLPRPMPPASRKSKPSPTTT